MKELVTSIDFFTFLLLPAWDEPSKIKFEVRDLLDMLINHLTQIFIQHIWLSLLTLLAVAKPDYMKHLFFVDGGARRLKMD
jgi:hypothetical protein